MTKEIKEKEFKLTYRTWERMMKDKQKYRLKSMEEVVKRLYKLMDTYKLRKEFDDLN